MKRVVFRLVMLIMLVVTGSWILGSISWAGEDCADWVVRIESVQGTVEVQKPGEAQWLPVQLKDTYCSGVQLRTGERSRAAILLRNETVLRLRQNTMITFSMEEKEEPSLLDLVTGVVHFFSRTPRSLQVNTPYVNALVEGTEFLLAVERDRTLISTFEGRVALSNAAGCLTVSAGESAVAVAGQPPVFKMVVHPRDAVQWAFYYPLVLNLTPDDFPDPDSLWQERVRRSIEHYWKNDLTGAFDSLSEVREDVRDPRFYSYRAVLLLTVGDLEAASKDIETVLGLDPENVQALALQSVIAVVRNKKDEALKLAERAVELDPASSAARIALSFAQQARFDVEGALKSVKEAIRLDPTNALAHARLAELWLSSGYLEPALKSATRAVELNPNLSRTQTVLGFAYLTQIRTKESREAFGRAIKLDQADPLPRLGLGLAKIREGDLAGGRREIEIALSLDPNNSLIRSYLGKAYYEEKREKKAREQFAIAEDLDPLDPTPWFYDAILKQTVNEPVNALHDLQKSIDLNDNRSVYRSRLLLDEDLASRSASLGRIFDDLGFQQLALVEGWKSLNTDPANFSAHRYLADTYSSVPRHEVARVSELLQAQLLQPININPVQPRLAESQLFIVEGNGPALPSFNEFNSLFNMNRLSAYTSGVGGSNGTFGDELVHSGVWNNLSYSLGQFHYETDGFRDNNDLNEDIYNVYAQLSLTPKTSAQVEWRRRDLESGDLSTRFDPDNFVSTLRHDDWAESERFGFHHSFTPNSDLIGSFIHQEAKFKVDFTLDPVAFNQVLDEDGYMGEIQHLFRSERFYVISGAGYYDADRTDVRAFSLPPPIPPPPPDIVDSHIFDSNVYAYSQLNYPDSVHWTLGAAMDFFRGIVDRDQFNPKFGVTWNPFPDTTFRAAVFRNLERPLLTNQTIEPTQIAGFTQFFDDVEGTRFWREGIAVDQKLSSNLFGGAEFSKRQLEVPFNNIPLPPALPSVEEADWDETLTRAYVYWTPHPWLATSLEFQYERLERDLDFPGDELLTKVDTYRVPLGLSFFHPSGLIARLRGTYVHQDGTFVNASGPVVREVSGEDSFWVFDASVGYRLPKRWGIVSLEARNLFDESFEFEDTDPANPRVVPERVVLLKWVFSF